MGWSPSDSNMILDKKWWTQIYHYWSPVYSMIENSFIILGMKWNNSTSSSPWQTCASPPLEMQQAAINKDTSKIILNLSDESEITAILWQR